MGDRFAVSDAVSRVDGPDAAGFGVCRDYESHVCLSGDVVDGRSRYRTRVGLGYPNG